MPIGQMFPIPSSLNGLLPVAMTVINLIISFLAQQQGKKKDKRRCSAFCLNEALSVFPFILFEHP
jgi:D-alanyl-lipoteichoic acid acyltransferase DltB (MBOAT superfamily)